MAAGCGGACERAEARRLSDLVYLVECQECRQHTRVDLTEMAKRMDEPLEWMKERLRCRCGSSRFFITMFRRREVES